MSRIVEFGKERMYSDYEPWRINLAIILFFSIGVGLVYFAGYVIVGGLLSKGWPEAIGQITKSEFVVSTAGDGTSYSANIQYRYRVENEVYESRRLKFGGHLNGERHYNEQLVAKYPEGATVAVYYNPGNPKTAVLEQSIPFAAYSVGLGGMVYLLAILTLAKRLSG